MGTKNIKIDNYLLHLELDGALEVSNLIVDGIGVGKKRGELAGLVESGAQEPRDLLDQRLGSKEGVVLLGQLLDELLLLVQLLEVVSAHEIDSLGLGLIAMVLISDDAHGELGHGHVTEPGYKKTHKTLRDLCSTN